MTTLSSADIVDRLRPQLTRLVAAVDTEPRSDEFRDAMRDLFDEYRQLLEEHDRPWQTEHALGVLEFACGQQGWQQAAGAVHVMSELHGATNPN